MMRKSPATQRTYRGIYERFAGWLSEHEGAAPASVDAFTPEALVDYLDGLERRCSMSTVKKERAALRKLARHLHQVGLIDATVILMVEIPTVHDTAPARQGLDRQAWEQVLTVARARLAGSPRARCSPIAAGRDLALIETLGGAGLRSHEARSLPTDPFDQGRSDNQGESVYRPPGASASSPTSKPPTSANATRWPEMPVTYTRCTAWGGHFLDFQPTQLRDQRRINHRQAAYALLDLHTPSTPIHRRQPPRSRRRLDRRQPHPQRPPHRRLTGPFIRGK